MFYQRLLFLLLTTVTSSHAMFRFQNPVLEAKAQRTHRLNHLQPITVIKRHRLGAKPSVPALPTPTVRRQHPLIPSSTQSSQQISTNRVVIHPLLIPAGATVLVILQQQSSN